MSSASSITQIVAAVCLAATWSTGCLPNDGGPPPPGDVVNATAVEVWAINDSPNSRSALLDDTASIDAWLGVEDGQTSRDDERAALQDIVDGLSADERLVAVHHYADCSVGGAFRFRGFYLDGSVIRVWTNLLQSPPSPLAFVGPRCLAFSTQDFYFIVEDEGIAEATSTELHVVVVDSNLPGPEYPPELNIGPQQ